METYIHIRNGPFLMSRSYSPIDRFIIGFDNALRMATGGTIEADSAGRAVPASLGEAHAERLVEEPERELLQLLAEYPDLIGKAATALEPHRITFYLLDVARSFHAYYNQHRAHQGIEQKIPAKLNQPRLQLSNQVKSKVIATPMLNGLHHSYTYAAC